MKKIKIILIASILLFLFCHNAMTQTPYKASVGGMISPVISMGVSCKTFFADHVAFQVDFLHKGIYTVYVKNYSPPYLRDVLIYGALEQNTNVMYQKRIKDQKKSELFWFCGGGVSVGFATPNSRTFGKFGANAIMGLEFVFKKTPLSIQIDLRPGYGILSYLSPPKYPTIIGGETIYTIHHFDWLVGFTLRYAFKEKGLEK